MRPTHKWLADIIERAPIYVVDLAEARRTGNTAAIAYAEAVRRWQDEASLAVAEAALIRSSGSGSRKPDDHARAALSASVVNMKRTGLFG